MKWKFILYILCLSYTISCNKNLDKGIILQESELEFSFNIPDSITYQFPGSAKGVIKCDAYIPFGIEGRIDLYSNGQIAFTYSFSTLRKLYPISLDTSSYQEIKLSWDLQKATLDVYKNNTLQTIRLINSEEITSINKINILAHPSNQNLKLREVRFKGELSEIPERVKIVAFGNSTTAFRNTITGVYTQRLPELLLKEGIPNIIFNEGIGVSHTVHLTDNNRHRVRHALDRLESNVLVHQPDITIICFGINDSWFDGNNDKPRIPIYEFEKNLEYIIDTLQKGGSKIILMTPNALGKRHEKWRYDNTEKYVEIIRKLAVENEIVLIDQWAIYENYSASGKDIDDFLLDGTHPNDTWHQKLAELLANSIKSITKSTKK